ncbi:hypothetical protein AOR04_11325 [Pseudoalteromonas sp. 1_2015MBL_MicDiv]|nr:hypothetical protein AOR04_11325 [Pseudoalteromonas sp. 1_2015MBL_MicDiv]
MSSALSLSNLSRHLFKTSDVECAFQAYELLLDAKVGSSRLFFKVKSSNALQPSDSSSSKVLMKNDSNCCCFSCFMRLWNASRWSF